MLKFWNFSLYGGKLREMLDHLGLPKFRFDFVEIESHKSSLLVMAIVDLNTMFFSVYYVFSPVRLQASGGDFGLLCPGAHISPSQGGNMLVERKI